MKIRIIAGKRLVEEYKNKKGLENSFSYMTLYKIKHYYKFLNY